MLTLFRSQTIQTFSFLFFFFPPSSSEMTINDRDVLGFTNSSFVLAFSVQSKPLKPLKSLFRSEKHFYLTSTNNSSANLFGGLIYNRPIPLGTITPPRGHERHYSLKHRFHQKDRRGFFSIKLLVLKFEFERIFLFKMADFRFPKSWHILPAVK